jgi:mRNA interferase RelE/StbE
MTGFSVNILPQAIADLSRLDKSVSQRVVEKIEWFSGRVESITPVPLRGPLSGFFKLRVGDWRVIYQIDYSGKEITVHRVGHRSEIYK